MPKLSRSSSKRSLSSAISMLSAEVPRILTPFLSRICVSFIAVWPPKATTTPTGFSTSMMFMTSSGVSGSKYSLSLMS